jgi:hypothetical protein
MIRDNPLSATGVISNPRAMIPPRARDVMRKMPRFHGQTFSLHHNKKDPQSREEVYVDVLGAPRAFPAARFAKI